MPQSLLKVIYHYYTKDQKIPQGYMGYISHITMWSGIYHDIYRYISRYIPHHKIFKANSLVTSHPSQQVKQYGIAFIGAPI